MVSDGKKGNIWKSKRWLAGLTCTLLLAVLAVGIFLWAPWETGQDASSEIQDVSDAEQEQSESSDSDTQTEDEEWLGQSLGYVGPNGEGALKDYDYETSEEYFAIIAGVFNSGYENRMDHEYVSDSEGEYAKGFLTVWFTCSEYDAHEIAEEYDAVWVSDYYMFMEKANDPVMVSLYFPDAPYREDLEEIAEAISAEDEVEDAYLLNDLITLYTESASAVTSSETQH